MQVLKLPEICLYLGACCPPGCGGVHITGISTDSRTIRPGELYIPLEGERFDGHDYILEAFLKGAAASLCKTGRNGANCPKPIIYVPDTLSALGTIAAAYRNKFDARVVGITGSVGKTTTKEMTAAVLSAHYKTLKTEGNLNNEVGLPHTLLRLDGSVEAAVIEMGMSGLGEISRLSKMASPDVAVITAIGMSHIGLLGSKEDILKAKLEIQDGLRPGGVLILNGDDPLLWGLKGRLPVKTIFCGAVNDSCDIIAENVASEAGELRFDIKTGYRRFQVKAAVTGAHNVKNMLLAAAAGLFTGLSNEEISRGFLDFRNVGMRQNIYRENGFTIMEDCYNSSPDSLNAALDVLSSLETRGKRIAVLGGMRELGEYAAECHRQCGVVASRCADALVLFGEDAVYFKEGANSAGMPEETTILCLTRSDAVRMLKRIAEPGDAILFKGSRLMKIEEVMHGFLGEEEI